MAKHEEIKMNIDVSVDTEKITEQVRAALEKPMQELADALMEAAWRVAPGHMQAHENVLMDLGAKMEQERSLADHASRTSDTMNGGE